LVIINLIKLPKILFKNARICIVIQDHQQNRILVIHPTPPKKIHQNPPTSFQVILQTDTQMQKHNMFGRCKY